MPYAQFIICVFTIFLMTVSPARSEGSKAVDLELVLAIDTSRSISFTEFFLQKKGIADAFRDPSVIEAIHASGTLGIAVSLVQWAGEDKQVTAIDWTHIRNAGDADRFAEAVEAMPRHLDGLTNIGQAIRHSVAKINQNRFHGRRKVIDISGDGPSRGEELPRQRAIALAQDITINGLVVFELNPEIWGFDLLDHYEKDVIGGTGAFAMIAKHISEFPAVIRKKLIREIIGLNFSSVPDKTTHVTANAAPLN